MSNEISPAKRMHVYTRDCFQCQYCGADVSNDAIRTIDHMQPRAKGGTNAIDNLTTACRICNTSKHTKSVEEFRAFIAFQQTEYANIITVRQYMKLVAVGAVLSPLPEVNFHFEAHQ